MIRVSALMCLILILLGAVAPAYADCPPWDVRAYCCPAACAVKKSPRWPEADRVLRSCAQVLGCSVEDARDMSVAMTCECTL